MRSWAVSLLALLLAACAGTPVAPRNDVSSLFNDRLFSAPSERISPDDIFALSADMQRFLNVEIAAQIASKGAREGLIDAVYRERQLRIEYDSVMTRNAAQAFAARSGNCLSLVIMTAAFAKALGLPVQFQTVHVEDVVSRSDNIYFFIGHVNLTLGTGRAVVRLQKKRARSADRRLSAAAANDRSSHPSDPREHRCRDVHEQPGGRGVRPRSSGRRLLVGTRRRGAGPGFRERL